MPDLLAQAEPQARPVVVFLAGQQGAGKSRMTGMVAARLAGRGAFADLDGDLYKPYHPAYEELTRRDDTLMAAYLGPDTWAWLAQAQEYVRSAVSMRSSMRPVMTGRAPSPSCAPTGPLDSGSR